MWLIHKSFTGITKRHLRKQLTNGNIARRSAPEPYAYWKKGKQRYPMCKPCKLVVEHVKSCSGITRVFFRGGWGGNTTVLFWLIKSWKSWRDQFLGTVFNLIWNLISNITLTLQILNRSGFWKTTKIWVFKACGQSCLSLQKMNQKIVKKCPQKLQDFIWKIELNKHFQDSLQQL